MTSSRDCSLITPSPKMDPELLDGTAAKRDEGRERPGEGAGAVCGFERILRGGGLLFAWRAGSGGGLEVSGLGKRSKAAVSTSNGRGLGETDGVARRKFGLESVSWRSGRSETRSSSPKAEANLGVSKSGAEERALTAGKAAATGTSGSGAALTTAGGGALLACSGCSNLPHTSSSSASR